ncbi:hypothetical protein EVAR_50537_1 [Eumeta japonica]|uniref:Uncharacterized protein n=1 Tax=Eumeta variegata TaxID=151549 RepID=A0A4C1YMI7_EUMVA|nr:hypothetical protein EVAR_50537_1 [Eumeta japonica]
MLEAPKDRHIDSLIFNEFQCSDNRTTSTDLTVYNLWKSLGRYSSLFMSQQSPERWLLTYDRNKESTEMSAKVRPPAHAARGDPNACSVLLDAGF